MAHVQLVHLNPFPSDLGEILKAYDHLLVPEANLGQLSKMVRAEYLVDAKILSKVQGSPFRAAEIELAVLELLGVDSPATTEADEEVAS